MPKFDSTTRLTVSEGYDFTSQQHYSKWRCRCRCNFLYRKCCSFRVWKVLVVLFILLIIFAIIVLLLMKYGPGRREISSGTDVPGGVGNEVYINSKCALIFVSSTVLRYFIALYVIVSSTLLRCFIVLYVIVSSTVLRKNRNTDFPNSKFCMFRLRGVYGAQVANRMNE